MLKCEGVYGLVRLVFCEIGYRIWRWWNIRFFEVYVGFVLGGIYNLCILIGILK